MGAPSGIGVDNYSLFFKGLFFVLLALLSVYFLTEIIIADSFGIRSYFHQRACDVKAATLPLEDRQAFLTTCRTYGDRACADASLCAGLPCISGRCVVQVCSTDIECPNNLCGLHSTPYPRLCTLIDSR
jgi:hypothetical protein